MARDDNSIEQWDRYWAYGNIHSFSQVAGGNYQGVVAGFWQVHFESLPGGARVLDVATGNGAIALLALEAGDRIEGGLEVHGVDLADIEPEKQVKDTATAAQLRRIAFHRRTGAEAMPFEDGWFDLVCSQFGVEYSDLARALGEIARVLKPGGRLAAIMHHRDSVLLQATRQELAQLDFVLNDAGLYVKARNLLRGITENKRRARGASGPDHKLQKKQRALRDAMDRVRREAESDPNPNMLLGPARYVHEIFTALDRGAPAQEMLGWLDEARRRVEANRQRLLDMTAAALGDDDLPEARAGLAAAGLTATVMDEFRQDDGAVLGWRLEARKPGTGTD